MVYPPLHGASQLSHNRQQQEWTQCKCTPRLTCDFWQTTIVLLHPFTDNAWPYRIPSLWGESYCSRRSSFSTLPPICLQATSTWSQHTTYYSMKGRVFFQSTSYNTVCHRLFDLFSLSICTHTHMHINTCWHTHMHTNTHACTHTLKWLMSVFLLWAHLHTHTHTQH